MLDEFNHQLMSFLSNSPTPFHATANLAELLTAAGFKSLDERDRWSNLAPNDKFFVKRNNSALVAGRLGQTPAQETGFRMAGAHTDSPCLRVKPNPVSCVAGCARVGVEVYGGVLQNPWFDRDLSLAGRIHYQTPEGQLGTTLIDFQRPIGVLPSLAIHLDREANTSRSINAQTDLPVLLQTVAKDASIDWQSVLAPPIAEATGRTDLLVLDFELSFYDCAPAALTGLNNEFIASARLDNLLSCFLVTRALIDAGGDENVLIVCNDHEEVGSVSDAGAQGRFLEATLERLLPDPEDRIRALAASMMVSADNAHAVHPNHADRHEPKHGPVLNGGPVLKINANQRYASNSETQAQFRLMCAAADVPMQAFVTRTDMACGSTIGPLTAANLGIKTVDVGVPQLAMHSIRELCGSADPHRLYRVLNELFRWQNL